MNDIEQYVSQLIGNAQKASVQLAVTGSAAKDAFLLRAAEAIVSQTDMLKVENARDIEAAEAAGISATMVDRLRLNDSRIQDMADGMRTVARLADPVGLGLGAWKRPNGIEIRKVSVPIGVIMMIFESRPNVTADAGALCLKSGNAVILRGGKEAIHSNMAIHKILANALEASGLDRNCIQMVNTPDRKVVDMLLEAEGKIDLIIPRGGEGLIRAVTAKSRVPVIKHYKGICHTYIDKDADLVMALSIAANAKLQRPSVCNAMETLLVHSDVAEAFLPKIEAVLLEAACEIRGCSKSCAIIPEMKSATSADWDEEYNELVLAVKVVESLDEAIEHINAHGSRHSDAIITSDLSAANEFSARVDAAGVFVNCSTRFNDGGEFGFGAEIGISTDKLHARGPMALPELTSYKYIINGNGQIRE